MFMFAAWVFFKRLKQRQHHGIGFNAPHYFTPVIVFNLSSAKYDIW